MLGLGLILGLGLGGLIEINPETEDCVAIVESDIPSGAKELVYKDFYYYLK